MKLIRDMSRKFKFSLLENNCTNPYQNFQIEENILKQPLNSDGILMLWQNTPCVVIGRFQEEALEINIDYLNGKNIPIIRRLTPGGTVYHDLGNLNVTFCKRKEDVLFSNYFLDEAKGIIGIVAKILKSFIAQDITVDERNSIYIEGKKISGSAATITNEKFFLHFSLLVNSDLEELNRIIKWKEEYPKESPNYIKSIRSPVANLIDFRKDLDMEKVKVLIKSAFKNYNLL
ncbi:lipoate--protein ligase family protein [Petrotoga sp. DB-2]